MVKLDLEMKKNILNKLNENRDCENELQYWFSKELLNEFGNYDIKKVEKLTTEDEGKYQYGGNVYQIYLNGQETDMYIMETWYRSGSYYSDYYYEYDMLLLCEKYTRTIEDWRVIKYE